METVSLEQTIYQCPDCDKEISEKDLIHKEDFDYCPDCGFEGWTGDFEKLSENE